MPNAASAVERFTSDTNVEGLGEFSEGFVDLGGLRMYRIAEFDALPPFLVNVVSDGDVWIYVSSAGGLTAGRVEPERCMFPYVTDDLLHRASDTGPRTALRVVRQGESAVLWEPFRARRGAGGGAGGGAAGGAGVQRNLYKPIEGCQLWFEEIRADLGLRFCYRWAPTRGLGLVRTAWLSNMDKARPVSVEVIDGLMNLLPAGIQLGTLRNAGCLINAYTQAEVDAETGLVTICLTSRISDTADPHESLTANTVWSCGLAGATMGLSERAYARFLGGQAAEGDTVLRNLRTDVSVRGAFSLEAGESKRWDLVADADRSQVQAVALRARLRGAKREQLFAAIDAEIESTRRGLTAIVAASDGLQSTADEKATAHHFSSVMFNSMRGGTVTDGYAIDVEDLLAFAQQRNRPVAEVLAGVLADHRREHLGYAALHELLDATGHADAVRVGLEYLPLSFGRRHGDPSRPWNMFAIHVERPDGQRILDYQGNWRDIFQNWEALACSFPRLLDGMVAKFVNASTPEGFNPYRISRAGIDWERPDPDDPWANIGYWGDHQIVYLLRLLELWQAHDPHGFRRRLDAAVYSYADVPYRLKPFAQVAADPKHSIEFDAALDRLIDARVEKLGSDGRLCVDRAGRVIHATLAEKLLVPLLSKVCNLVPGGGVWMNTQRPEWNDANNALAGFGLSVVTTCYLRKYAALVHALLVQHGATTLQLSEPVATWLREVAEVLSDTLEDVSSGTMDDARRLAIVTRLGEVFERYRQRDRAEMGEAAVAVGLDEVTSLLEQTRRHAEATIRRNRRADGLYHSYNLIDLRAPGRASIRTLDVMLEGQVAVLSSGVLDPASAQQVLAAMFDSALYRADVASFTLYPRRDRPKFLDHNVLPEPEVLANELLAELLRRGDRTIVERDAEGKYRFNATFSNAADVAKAMQRLAQEPVLAALVETHGPAVAAFFDATFDHHAFTGRSGTMYGYEGLGCVYWHMVAKLQVAAQECWLAARDGGADAAVIEALRRSYGRVRDGLGFRKDAVAYGTFPTDAYSHTPANRGAQQPGMTGQVKEEMLTRRAEMGVRVMDGRIHFEPELVATDEFRAEASTFAFYDLAGQRREIDVPADSIAFTLCQVPVTVSRPRGGSVGIALTFAEGSHEFVKGTVLEAGLAAEVFNRSGRIVRVSVAGG